MIKRRFYRFEHGDKDAPSDSSSSSDSEVEAEATDDTEIEEDEEENISDVRDKAEASSSSGYESEDSSANEVNLDSSGLPTSDDDVAVQDGRENIVGSFVNGESNSLPDSAHHSPEKDEKTNTDIADCVIKCKTVFKCRLCPRIVCLSEETLKAHLNSKRHARSEKLLKGGRLKLMLNDDGQIEARRLLKIMRQLKLLERKQRSQIKRTKDEASRERETKTGKEAGESKTIKREIREETKE